MTNVPCAKADIFSVSSYVVRPNNERRVSGVDAYERGLPCSRLPLCVRILYGNVVGPV